MASGRINNVVIRDAAQHGLGIYNVPGWIQNSQVTAASTETDDTWSACKVSSSAPGARVEDCLFNTTDCDHGIDATGDLRVGGIDMIGTVATNGDYSVPAATIWSRAFTSPYSLGGTLSIGTGTFRLPFSYGARVISVRTAVSTAPTGDTLIVDVHKNGTTIFTTQGNRPIIPISSNISNIAIPDVFAIVPGDYITIDIDQVGSTIAGEDLVVSLQMENDTV